MTADNPQRHDPPAPALTWHRVTIRGGPSAHTCRVTLDGQVVHPTRLKVEADARGALHVTLEFPAIVDLDVDAEILDDQAGVLRYCGAIGSDHGERVVCGLAVGHIGPHQSEQPGAGAYQWLDILGRKTCGVPFPGTADLHCDRNPLHEGAHQSKQAPVEW